MDRQVRSRWLYGTPSFLEHDGYWKRAPSDPDVTPEEYDQVYHEFDAFISHRIAASRGSSAVFPDVPYYFRGNFTGDRTQQLDFRDFSELTPEFVRELQAELEHVRGGMWRIIIWAWTPEELIVVYPNVVCIDTALSEAEQDARVSEVARRQVARDARREDERQARIARVRPLLRDAYGDARASDKLAYLVHAEGGSGKDDGRVWMWLIHPSDSNRIYLNEYRTQPYAQTWETFYLLPDASLVTKRRDAPDEAVLLVLWGFTEGEEHSLTLQRGLETIELPCPPLDAPGR